MLRTVVGLALFFIITVTLAPVVVLATMLGVKEREGGLYEWSMRLFARALVWAAGARIEIHGEGNVLRGRGAVYVFNHVSWYDVFSLAAVLPRYTFVAKSELRRIPIFGWGAEAAGVVFIDRDNRRAAFDVFRGVAEELKRGRNVAVAPEGTRGDSYVLRPFKKGPFVLAITAGVPVVPVIIYGSREVMPKGQWALRPGTIHLHFLERIDTVGHDYESRDDVMRLAAARMRALLHDHYGVASPDRAVAAV